MAKTIQQLQIAHRIHQVLVREIDHAIEVERLLTDAHYARDVLLVCDALAGSEAPPLATQLRLLPMPMPAAAAARDPVGAPGHAQQPTEGSHDPSGFDLTQPPPVAPVADARPRAASPSASPSASRPAGRPAGRPDHHRNWLTRWRDSR